MSVAIAEHAMERAAFFEEQQGHEGECATLALATRGAEVMTAEGATQRLALAGRAEAAWRVEVFIMEADMVQSSGRRLLEGWTM